MAAVLGTIARTVGPELGTIVGGESGGALAKGLLSGLGFVAATDLINYLTGKRSGDNPAMDDTVRKHHPRYALVDLKKDEVLVFMGSKRAYRFLLRPRRRAARTKVIREIVHETTR